MPLQNEIDDLKTAWQMMFPSVPVPTDGQWTIWRLLHPAESIRYALAELGKKYLKLGGEMETAYMVRFASSVMSKADSARGKDADGR
jgi:hypothetical protein